MLVRYRFDMPKRRFVVLDRDGTIIEERNYLSDPNGVTLIPGVARALGELRGLGLGLVVITNQAGVGRGFFDVGTLDRIHEQLSTLLKNEGVELDGIYVCPHHPDDGCPCRKPKPGLMERASRELNFDPAQSFVIGDKALDVEFGQVANATTILIRTGYGREVEAGGFATPNYICDDLSDAVRVIRRVLLPD